MKVFIVPVKIITTEYIRIEAESAEEAMNKVLEDGLGESVQEIEEDPEVYYPDIEEEA